MQQSNIDEIYKENDLMKRELKTMEMLQEENQDLREEVARLKAMSYEDRVKEIGDENQKLRRRNGELLIQNTDLQSELTKLKREQPLIPDSLP